MVQNIQNLSTALSTIKTVVPSSEKVKRVRIVSPKTEADEAWKELGFKNRKDYDAKRKKPPQPIHVEDKTIRWLPEFKTDDAWKNLDENDMFHQIEKQIHSGFKPKEKVEDREWQKRLQYLVKAREMYSREKNRITMFPGSKLRAIEGLDPSYGSYADVKDFGWDVHATQSMRDQGLLGYEDKVAIGMTNPKTGKNYTSMLISEQTALDGIKEANKDKNNRQKGVQDIARNLVKQTEELYNLNNMSDTDDDLTKLSYILLKRFTDDMHTMLDDEKLQKETGINILEDDLKRDFVAAKFLPDIRAGMPPATAWLQPDNEIAQKVTGSEFWKYVTPYLFSPINSDGKLVDPMSRDDSYRSLDPLEGLSPLAKSFISGARNNLEHRFKPANEYQEKAKDWMLSNPYLFRKSNSDEAKPFGVFGIPGVTRTQGVAPESFVKGLGQGTGESEYGSLLSIMNKAGMMNDSMINNSIMEQLDILSPARSGVAMLGVEADMPLPPSTSMYDTMQQPRQSGFRNVMPYGNAFGGSLGYGFGGYPFAGGFGMCDGFNGGFAGGFGAMPFYGGGLYGGMPYC